VIASGNRVTEDYEIAAKQRNLKNLAFAPAMS
jgi:hypothetical protein